MESEAAKLGRKLSLLEAEKAYVLAQLDLVALLLRNRSPLPADARVAANPMRARCVLSGVTSKQLVHACSSGDA